MILIDANLLLYAYHPRAEQHEKSRVWLETVLSGPDLVRFAWLTLWAFLRIATNARVFERPLSASEADISANLALLRERDWIDLPFVYETGQRAILTFEKGPQGDQVFQKAMAAWTG